MGPQTTDLGDHKACDSSFGSQGWSEAYPVTDLRKDWTGDGVVGEIQDLEALEILQTLWNLAGKLPRRFFFSFQHANPWRLQIEATDEFVKVHELSLLVESEREFFTPCKHITSSSTELLREKQKIEANQRIRKIFIVFYSQRFDFDFYVLFLLFLVLVFQSEVGLLGSTYLRWVFLSLRFFCLDQLCCIFGLIWYFGAFGFDDFAGFEKVVILRFFNFWILIFGFVFLDLNLFLLMLVFRPLKTIGLTQEFSQVVTQSN